MCNIFPVVKENEKTDFTEPKNINIVVSNAENNLLAPWSNCSKLGSNESWVASFPNTGTEITTHMKTKHCLFQTSQKKFICLKTKKK